MNQQRAKKIGAVYYKDLKTKFSPGDVAIDPSNGKVTKFPSDPKKFAAFCDKLYGGYFVKVKLTASIKEALFVETRLAELEAETDKYEDKQYKLREKMMNMVTKGQTEIICVFMNRNGDEMVTVEEVTKAIGQDKLLSLGRRYNDKHRCLWVALVETKGFADNKSYYALQGHPRYGDSPGRSWRHRQTREGKPRGGYRGQALRHHARGEADVPARTTRGRIVRRDTAYRRGQSLHRVARRIPDGV